MGEPAADPTPPPATTSMPPPPPQESAAQGAAGQVYADVPNRAVAYIIDAIILFVINLVIGLILGTFLPAATFNPDPSNIFGAIEVNYTTVLVTTLVSLAINGLYFIYSWTAMRGSPGQKALGMQVTNPDGATVTQGQAFKRWIFLGAPFGLASALNPIPVLGWLIALAGFAYFIYLLWSTAQSPTKQGFHDVQANTIVVKSARSVA
jgi:uncharacterized RDD family membrane protein YckC